MEEIAPQTEKPDLSQRFKADLVDRMMRRLVSSIHYLLLNLKMTACSASKAAFSIPTRSLSTYPPWLIAIRACSKYREIVS
jgi:hypothetical protein